LPFLALAVEAVHVEHDRLAEHSRDVCEGAVGNVAEQDDIVVTERDMHSSEEGTHPRVEMLLVQAGDNDAPHAAIVDVVGLGERPAAIDRDPMSAVGQARADLLGEALETAIAVRDAASADNGDLHFCCSLLALCSRQLLATASSTSTARGVLQNHHSKSRSETRRRD